MTFRHASRHLIFLLSHGCDLLDHHFAFFSLWAEDETFLSENQGLVKISLFPANIAPFNIRDQLGFRQL